MNADQERRSETVTPGLNRVSPYFSGMA